ncbi:plexin domain-containing protein 2-like isoform X2 [Patiria miniata]|uniref:EGF-like domain-containing protein n=1 Tax=Patiria miniata TaxID=46514 RepID=A0A914A4Y2_PATMI|nr:plexin domain-containing protein 2-like isoform X2 [Patiria miniata]
MHHAIAEIRQHWRLMKRGANQTVIVEDNHSYYTSHCYQPHAGGSAFWVDLDDPAISHDVEAPEILATRERKGTNVHLNFIFPFYGHDVRSLVITTGGFIYAGAYIHRHLAATQYIAPLMGNFCPSDLPAAGVRFYDNGTALTVEWREQNLVDNIPAGLFTFQATLFEDGRILFAYKQVPIPISSISEDGHPVKVGLADAYYIDQMIAPFTKKREIFEYHKVELDMSLIDSGTAVLISPLPTCNQQTSCSSCVANNIAFNCSWCATRNKCSDGFDHHRQSWLESDCNTPVNYIDEITKCPGYTPPPSTEAPPPTGAPPPTDGQPPTAKLSTAKSAAATTRQKPKAGPTVDYCKGVQCQHGGVCEEGFCNCPPKFEGARCQKLVDGPATHSQSSGNPGLTVGAVVCIVLITLLVLGLFIWAVYAYRHPTSPSGLFILEAKHRIKGRGRGSNGVKYKYHQQMDGNQIDIQF